MLSPTFRLYTWVDVEEVLLQAQAQENWPTGLYRATAYWDGLKLTFKPRSKKRILDWLEKLFPLSFDRKHEVLRLQSLPEGPKRECPVIWEEADQTEVPAASFLPLLGRPRLIVGPKPLFAQPPPYAKDWPPIIAVHSFKGGVGKTLHALALAQSVSRERMEPSVLLVDGDLEAPGLSWLLQTRMPNPLIAYTDLLTIAHGDPDPEKTASLKLVASLLRDSPIDGFYVLPAFRDVSRFNSLEIRPEHLLHGGGDPFLLTHLLASLGQMLGVDAIIIDLRSGLSELSSELLLDPRIHRLLITNMSGQSLSGMKQVIELIAERAPITEKAHPLPALLFSFVNQELMEPVYLEPRQQPLTDSLKTLYLTKGKEVSESDYDPVVLVSPLRTDLLSLPLDWDTTLAASKKHDLPAVMASYAYALPLGSRPIPRLTAKKLNEKREKLLDFLNRLETVAAGGIVGGVVTSAISRAVRDLGFRRGGEAITGYPGSGKTHLFLQMLCSKSLVGFVKNLGEKYFEREQDSYFFPLLAPLDFSGKALEVVEQAEYTLNQKLGLPPGRSSKDLRQKILRAKNSKLFQDPRRWRAFWMNCLAWRLGLTSDKDPFDSDKDMIFEFREFDFKEKSVGRLIVLADGIDELLPLGKFGLRELFLDMPDIYSRNIQILPFLSSSIPDKSRSSLSQWSREEFLTLLAWIVSQAGIDYHDELENWVHPLDELAVLDRLQFLADHALTGHVLYSALYEFQQTARRGFPGLVIQLLKRSVEVALKGAEKDGHLLPARAIKQSMQAMRKEYQSSGQ